MSDVDKLLEGYQRFYQKHFVRDNALYQELREGQAPRTLIITCSDSRVDPAMVMQADPGDIFVIRNVANLVPPYQPKADSLHGVSAALEFGVCHLGVSHVVVMGHSGCAGIRALREGISPPDESGFSFITPWVRIGEPARALAAQEENADRQQSRCEQEAIKVSLTNLLTFPWIKSRIETGALQLHGWYFRISDGALLMYRAEKNGFVTA